MFSSALGAEEQANWNLRGRVTNDHIYDVIIVGAGAAGLAALRELDRAGKRVLCLEARDRIGGRIFTIRDGRSPIPIELGAEFVHGRPPEILKVVTSAPLTLYKCTEHAVHVRNGRVMNEQDAWVQVDEVMSALKAAVESGRDESFAEFLRHSDHPSSAKELATSYVEGFNAARSEVISIQALVKDQEAAHGIDGDTAFRLMGGYDELVRWLLQGIADVEQKLKQGCEVQSIRWKEGDATVEFRSGPWGSAATVKARSVIVTVPLGVLQAGAIRFDPAPEDSLKAANQLAFGQVFRVILRFDRPVWVERKEFAEAGFLLSKEKNFPTWWTTLPVQASSITGWSAGPRADELSGLPEAEVFSRAIEDLAHILRARESEVRERLQAVYFHNWQADPFARGAYSYVPAGAMSARETLAQPVANTLYFAGEATETNGHSATVHGAIATGIRAAKYILES
jgi:monoamine oxidase